MKLLVTGGAGFIGSNFIDHILEITDYSVINLDTLSYAGTQANALKFQNNSRYTFVQGDIAEEAVVTPLVEVCDVIVNFAAESHVDRSIDDPSPFAYSNVIGTMVLLNAARKFNRRFHQISTDEVFGSLGETGHFTENSPYQPRSPYSASKASADHFVRAYYHTYQVPITISHCSNNYGPYQHPEKFIAKSITNLLQHKPIQVYGNGKNVRDWIHVSDHVRGILTIIEHGTIGETYCFGGQVEKSNIELAREIVAVMGRSETEINFTEDRKGHDFRYAVDISHVQKQHNWKPTADFSSMLKDTISWYENNPSWWQPLIS